MTPFWRAPVMVKKDYALLKIWYKDSPRGHGPLDACVATAAAELDSSVIEENIMLPPGHEGLPWRLTNYCCRKRPIALLQNACLADWERNQG